MTDSTGAVVETRQYDAWGNLEVGADQPGYAFTGGEWDPETGLYCYRARYYDPKIGKFISEDSVGLGGGVDFHVYVGNNPLSLSDPMGLLAAVPVPPSGLILPVACVAQAWSEAFALGNSGEGWRYGHRIASCRIRTYTGGWCN
jgi:RHS repeat-associated protein